jgi:hypothetical protein
MVESNNINDETCVSLHTDLSAKNLMDLPTELHIHIASFLSYPDALALKHTSSLFYLIVDTGVELKIDWLVERFERKLECPMEKCSFRTDASFCNWRIKRIMERRRRHLECRPGKGGCFVVDGESCTKDVMPIWLKNELKGWKRWRNEGGLIYSNVQMLFFTDLNADVYSLVLIFGALFIFWTLLWSIFTRCVGRYYF